MTDFALLKELTQAWGVAGREKAVRAIILRELEGLADGVRVDSLGNVIALKRGRGGPVCELGNGGLVHLCFFTCFLLRMDGQFVRQELQKILAG